MKRSKKPLKSSSNTPLSPRETLSPFARSFIKRVQNTAALYSLWKPNQSFVVAVSGGPDSLCLLDVLVMLSKKHAFTLHVAHVNYRLRGEASDQDEELVRQQASKYSLECTVFKPKKSNRANLEERLREERYAFFEHLREEKGCDAIAVAHNEDDQAETFLLRLLRGAGLEGLSSMQPKNGLIVRPLLQMNRCDILRYLKERQLPYREDTSNHDTAFMRNRIRHELLPFLEKNFQPQVKKVLARNALLIASDYALLQELASTAPLADTERGSDVEKTFRCSELLAYPEPVLRYKLRALIQPFFPGKAKTSGFIDEIIKSLKSRKGKIQTVSCDGLKFVRKGGTVTLLISERKKKK